MSNKPAVKLVNVTPMPMIFKTKVEKPDDDDEVVVACKICAKTFVSEVALTNHARIQHTSVFLNGNPDDWQEPIENKNEDPSDEVKSRLKHLINSMSPTALNNLMSKNVKYVLFKSDNPKGTGAKKEQRDSIELSLSPPKKRSKKKEAQPITGPFECIQPLDECEGRVCHQIYFSCCEFSVHVRDEHSRRSRKLNRCQVCEKPLISEDAPDPLRPYVCDLCNAAYANSDELSDHLNAEHVKPKPFRCELCQKRFTQQAGLQQHLRMHAGDRPYPCAFCCKRFTQKSGLDQHLRIHTKVRPYRCIVCDKAFIQSVHLKQHMRTHTNVQPFHCAICQKRFKQRNHLNYHLRNHMSVMTPEQREAFRELLDSHGMPEHEPAVEIEISEDALPGYGPDAWTVQVVSNDA